MAWIKKSEDIVEQEQYAERVSVTNGYAGKVTAARLSNSKTPGSKSVSLFVEITTNDGEIASDFFTIMGKDGETFYINKHDQSKRQHIGLNTANTLFLLALGKEIFDIEPSDIKYMGYDKEAEERVEMKGKGFPEIIGKEIGAAIQVTKEGEGADTKFGTEIQHFFNPLTGRYWNESDNGSVLKIDKWIKKAPEYKIIESFVPKRSFGGAKDADKPEKKGWGR